MHQASENPERNSYGDPLRHRDTKRVQAQRRQAARAARSDREQLDLLIARGHEYCREANRLREKLGEAAVRPK